MAYIRICNVNDKFNMALFLSLVNKEFNFVIKAKV